MWRPKNWQDIKWGIMRMGKDNPTYKGGMLAPDIVFEAGADAMLETLKKRGLYGEYGEDFIVSSRVKQDNPDWAEDFYETLKSKGWLVFIEDK